jgi:capsular exopolysaccharide synthesis family protein
MSYAQLGRKTILVNCDLRKKMNYFGNDENSEEGLSTYLCGHSNLEDIIVKSPVDKLEYIPAGAIPPNPVELMAGDRTETLLNVLKSSYDIIVLDTTPLAQVTDAYLLVGHADLKLIVVRQDFTLKKILLSLIKDMHLKNINNTCLVLNNNKRYMEQYGYGTGYDNKKRLIRSVTKFGIHN